MLIETTNHPSLRSASEALRMFHRQLIEIYNAVSPGDRTPQLNTRLAGLDKTIGELEDLWVATRCHQQKYASPFSNTVKEQQRRVPAG